jgi:trans-aconitate methyltransferase
MLADRGCTVTGVDLDPARVAWCRALVPEGEFSSGDVRSCRLATTYDAVICSEVLEHLGASDRQAALHNLVGHLRAGAILVVTVPSATYIRLEPVWERIRAWRYGPEGHDDETCHQIVAPAQIEAGLRAAGCEVERAGSACCGLIRWWVARKR